MGSAVTNAGDLNEAVAFDEPVQSTGPGGVTSPIWFERHACRAQFIYSRGSEVVEAARLEGRSTYKVRVRQCEAARRITADWRMRDTRRGTEYAVIEVDSITDRAWIYIVAQSVKVAG